MTHQALIPVHRILLPPNITAGMNPLVVMSLAYWYRTHTGDLEPIQVEPLGFYTDPLWQLDNGKHRLFGSVIAGRPTILADWSKHV